MKVAAVEVQLYNIQRSGKEQDAQRMVANITILQDNLDSTQVIEDKARRSISSHVRGVGSKSEDAQNSGHNWQVIRDLIEHGTIRPIVHRIEGNLELDCSTDRKHRLNNDWNERSIVDIMVSVHRPQIGE